MKISYTKHYGEACYELSGEYTKENNVDFKSFILEVLRIGKSELEGENKIPMPLRYALVNGVFNGGFGDAYGISYDDIRISNKNATKKELLDIFKDIYINYDKMSDLREKTLDKLLSF